jgi:tRNA threonylcarbamoyl adenosine modification protein YeaZ
VNVLAIDTSARHRCVCVIADERGVLAHSAVHEGMTVAEALPRSITALRRAVPSIDAVVVVVGPGSYTGLRAGMAAGLGAAQSLGVGLHGVGTLDVIAAGLPAGKLEDDAGVIAVADAGRGAVYAARCVRDGSVWRAGPPRRQEIAALTQESAAPASFDALDLPGLIHVDPADALARAVPAALAAAALSAAGLHAVYTA